MLLLVSIEFQSGKMKKVLKMDGGDSCITMWMDLMSLKMVKMLNKFYAM